MSVSRVLSVPTATSGGCWRKEAPGMDLWAAGMDPGGAPSGRSVGGLLHESVVFVAGRGPGRFAASRDCVAIPGIGRSLQVNPRTGGDVLLVVPGRLRSWGGLGISVTRLIPPAQHIGHLQAASWPVWHRSGTDPPRKILTLN